MSDKSTIEWTDATWNPVRGCVKVSPGCKHCYAETFAERFRGVPGHPYEQGFDPRLVPDKLGEPLRWKKGRRIFVNSMSDLFQEAVPDDYIAACFGVMASCQQHTFQILTKRAKRMEEWFRWIASQETGPHALCVLEAMAHPLELDSPMGKRDRLNCGAGWPWPLPVVHLGVSVENRRFGLPRIEHLRRTPAAVRFLSVEPLLEDIGEIDLTGIHQVIVGAESGHGARGMDEQWVRRLRDQAVEQGVAFFYKQATDPTRRGKVVSLPVLDGRQWAQMPVTRTP